MMTAIDLSAAARAELIVFCQDHLKPGFDAVAYADGMLDEADLGEGAHFEIRGSHCADGNPATISFHQEEDFVWREIDDQ